MMDLETQLKRKNRVLEKRKNLSSIIKLSKLRPALNYDYQTNYNDSESNRNW